MYKNINHTKYEYYSKISFIQQVYTREMKYTSDIRMLRTKSGMVVVIKLDEARFKNDLIMKKVNLHTFRTTVIGYA